MWVRSLSWRFSASGHTRYEDEVMPDKDLSSTKTENLVLPPDYQAIRDALQVEMAQIPPAIAGKSTEELRANLAHFVAIWEIVFGRLSAGCSDSATKIWLWVDDTTYIEFLGNDGSWELAERVPIRSAVGGGAFYFLRTPTIFRLMLGTKDEGVGVNLRPYSGDTGPLPIAPPIICASYVLYPWFIYVYEGGVALRSTVLSNQTVKDCTFYFVDYSGQGDDFTIDDSEWYDAINVKETVKEFVIPQPIRSSSDLVELGVEWITGEVSEKDFLEAISDTMFTSSELVLAGLVDSRILEQLFKLPLRSTDDALQMAEYFIEGSGQTMVHGPGSSISEKVRRSDVFTNLVDWTRDATASSIRYYNGFVDCATLQWKPNIYEGPPGISWGLTDIKLGFPIGGTQGLKIEIVRLIADHSSRSFSATVRFTIFDDFGVGSDDRYTPPLEAFWILQHVKQMPEDKYKPFRNEIVVESSITGEW